MPDTKPEPNLPPITQPPTNEFANASLDDIFNWIRENSTKLKALDFTTIHWVVIDAKGIETQTALLGEHVYEFADEESEHGAYGDKYRMLRMPYEYIWCTFANLDIANMGFEEYAEMDAGVQEDGAYKWVGPFPFSNEAQKETDKELKERRAKVVAEMRKLGHIE